jgi:hypothetical protein
MIMFVAGIKPRFVLRISSMIVSVRIGTNIDGSKCNSDPLKICIDAGLKAVGVGLTAGLRPLVSRFWIVNLLMCVMFYY